MCVCGVARGCLLQADGFVVDEDFADGDEGEEEGGGGEEGSGGEEDAGVRKKRRKRRRDKQFALDEEDYDLLEEAVSFFGGGRACGGLWGAGWCWAGLKVFSWLWRWLRGL